MPDLNPTEIYRRYQRNELDKVLAVDYLKSIIETSSDEILRVQSVELLGEMELEATEIFEFFEELVTSDLNEEVRLAAVQAIINKFLEKGERLLKWVIKHERSCDCLLGIYHTLSSKESGLVEDLLLLMEETIGINYLIHYDLLPKEAMALELLGRHLCTLYVFAEVKKWKFYDLKIVNQRVVSIKIENLYNSINSKFFSLFSGLRELTLIDSELRDAIYLGGITSLRIAGREEGPLHSIDGIKGFENLVNLKELYLYYNSISEISKLENLTKLEKIDLSHNDIKEIKGLDTLKNLQSLNLEGNEIEEIKNLENLVNLRELNLSENKDISEIKGLESLINLEELLLFNNYLIKEIKGLEKLRNLRILVISKDTGMITFKAITADINWVTPFQEGMDVKEYTKNQEILNKKHSEYQKKLYDDRDYIREIKGLDTLSNLEELYLEGNSITEIKGLARLENLRILSLSKNKIEEIKGLENLKNLNTLFLDNNKIVILEGLEGLENDSGVLEPQKFVEYCSEKNNRKKKLDNYII